MRRTIIIVVACVGLFQAALAAATSDSRPRLEVPPQVTTALCQDGFLARTQCGGISDFGVPTRTVSGCWLVIERPGYSVHVVPHSTVMAARAAYERTYNRWARNKRMAVVRNLVVYEFRVPASPWQTIRGLVMGATR